MYKIIYMGSYNHAICNMIAKFTRIEVISYIVDESVSLEEQAHFRAFWNQKGVPEVSLCEEAIQSADCIFVCCYTKIIKNSLIEKYNFVNIHAGNLPKWRGISSNSWAILNGEYTIAYTLHRVTDVLDGGPIYHKFTYTLDDSEKYGDGRKKLEQSLSQNLESVLCEICSGANTGTLQHGKYVYTPSFRREDGKISFGEYTSRELFDLFRVLGAPYGSGLYFLYKGDRYEFMDMEIDSDFMEYRGIPGAICYKNKGRVWVKTKDSAIILNTLKKEEDIIKAEALFQIGVRI